MDAAEKISSLAVIHIERLVSHSLAQLEREDLGWTALERTYAWELEPHQLQRIRDRSRLMYLRNPLIQRAIEIRASYIFAQGVSIFTEDEPAQETLDSLMADSVNLKELFGHQALIDNEHSLEMDGELFFALFPTDPVGIRSLAPEEMDDPITDPKDRGRILYYPRRERSGKVILHPSLFNQRPPRSFDGKPVEADTPVHHVKVGGIKYQKRGMPETYAVLDWARAYTQYLEDCASLASSLALLSWLVTGDKDALKKYFSDELGVNQPDNGQPPAAPGSWLVGDQNIKAQALPKSGAGLDPAEGKPYRLMVASGMHLPDTILSNDPQQGALATAKTLDRPTELAILDRQKLWRDTLKTVCDYVLERAGHDTSTQVDFPPILQRDLASYISSIVEAATFNGQPLLNIAPLDFWRRLILAAFEEKDIDAQLEEVHNQGSGAQTESELRAVVEKLKTAGL